MFTGISGSKHIFNWSQTNFSTGSSATTPAPPVDDGKISWPIASASLPAMRQKPRFRHHCVGAAKRLCESDPCTSGKGKPDTAWDLDCLAIPAESDRFVHDHLIASTTFSCVFDVSSANVCPHPQLCFARGFRNMNSTPLGPWRTPSWSPSR